MKMTPNNHSRFSTRKLSLLFTILAALGLFSMMAARADVVFDNISNAENGVAGAAITGTGSTPNTFMGDGYVLAAGTMDITGFDLFPVNFTASTTYTGLKVTIYVWGTVNTGTVSAGSPAFGSLLNTYTYTTPTISLAPGGNVYSIEDGTSPGIVPGYTLATPLTLSSTTIGLTFNVQGTTDGVNYSSANLLTSIISYGTLPTVGSQIFNGYYRNAASEANGNFTSTLRSLGLTDQSLAVRVYGDVTPVPEPTALALIGAGGLALLLIRRRP
jgi:hypothetical protein